MFDMFFAWFGSLPNAAAQGLIWGIMAIGVYITFKILDIADLTVDGTFCTGGAVCAVLITSGVNPWIALLVAVVAGLLAGLLTGLLHTAFGIPTILSGILSQLILWSVNLKIMGRSFIPLLATQHDVILASSRIWPALLVVMVFSGMLVGLLYCFFGTEVGASLRATGNNQHMSRAQGINTNITKILGLVLSNGVVALAGALQAQYSGTADINMGKTTIVISLAAIVIGDAIMSRISKNLAARLAGGLLGGLAYSVVYQTVVFIGLDADLMKLISACVVIAFLAVPYLKEKYFTKGVQHHA